MNLFVPMTIIISPPRLRPSLLRCFRSKAALEALDALDEQQQQGSSLILYNYPSFSGAFGALFAQLYHSRLQLPFLTLPFSQVLPFHPEDFTSLKNIHTCFLLDFIGPKGFALNLSRFIPQVIAFDHRNSTLSRISTSEFQNCPNNLKLHIHTHTTSARSAYNYFSEQLPPSSTPLLDHRQQHGVHSILQYLDDSDLHKWALPQVREFNVGLREERSKLNCLTNPYIFHQLLELDSSVLIAKVVSQASCHRDAAHKFLDKAFKIRLGRGLYGECLGVRAEKSVHLSNEIGEELSKLSASAGLRPIGAVIFMQRGFLKICLRSTDAAIDTARIAKVYGGGGRPSSSSFVIRMDEYNHWTNNGREK